MANGIIIRWRSVSLVSEAFFGLRNALESSSSAQVHKKQQKRSTTTETPGRSVGPPTIPGAHSN